YGAPHPLDLVLDVVPRHVVAGIGWLGGAPPVSACLLHREATVHTGLPQSEQQLVEELVPRPTRATLALKPLKVIRVGTRPAPGATLTANPASVEQPSDQLVA